MFTKFLKSSIIDNVLDAGILYIPHVFCSFFGNFTLIRLRKQHALKGFAICQHALKEQKLLAQGIALGNHRHAPLAL